MKIIYGEGARRFVLRRDGEGRKRNNNLKSGQKSNNISNNIFALPLKRNSRYGNGINSKD
tara:strand:+ start:544 stop:723 length:180 start_codon:yes stop_codon:yes gene_type:complete